MTTVIDSLVLELGLDPAKFTSGLSKALAALAGAKETGRKHAQEVERSTKGIGEQLSALQSNALKVLGLFTAGMGLKEFVQQTVVTDRTVGRLSNILGISTEKLSGWRNAAVLWGGSAEGISSTIKSLSLELAKFSITGESSIIPYLRSLGINAFDGMGHLKKATDLLLDISDAVQNRRLDPAQATYILQSLGADEATINAMLKGRRAMGEYLKAANQAGVITKRDAEAADKLTEAWGKLMMQSSSLGRKILTDLTPALVGVLNWVRNLMDPKNNDTVQPGDEIGDPFGNNPTVRHGGGGRRGRTTAGPTDVAQYIVEAARKRGIDPRVALAVAKSEGLNSYIGDRGSSFGPFQLHYGGVAGGGMAVSGLGDEFTRKTGMDARDPSTVKSQIDFALDYAATHGWGAWHGWRGAQFAGIGAGGGSSRTVTQHIDIQKVEVNVPNGDAASIGTGLRTTLARQGLALQSNAGPE